MKLYIVKHILKFATTDYGWTESEYLNDKL